MEAPKAQRIKLDLKFSDEPVVDNQWLDKGVERWPTDLLIHVEGAEGVYAKTLMHEYEPKVSERLSLFSLNNISFHTF